MSKPLILLLVFVITSLVIANHASAQAPTTPTYYSESCRPQFGNYRSNNTYESNVKSVLNILWLASNASFNNTSSVSGTDMVYSQYYCRRDIGTQLCSDFIKEAAQTVLSKCSNSKAGTMWFEECTLRYDNESMLGIEAEFPNSYLYASANVTKLDKFNVVLRDTRDMIIEKSAYGNESFHFATGE